MIEHIKIFPDIEDLSRMAVEKTIEWAKGLLDKQPVVSIALPGGNSPKAYYRIFSQQYQQALPWDKIHFFTIDEQFSPPGQKGWIYQQAETEFFSALSIPPGNLHRVPVTAPSWAEAAALYEKDILNYREKYELPLDQVFDILILGMGTDGHVACLFPQQESLDEKIQGVIPVHPPEPQADQEWITLTYPFMNHSQYALFLVNGASKAPVISTLYNYPEKARLLYPCARVSPLRELIWAVDQDALGFDPQSL